MNKTEADVLLAIAKNADAPQRTLAKEAGCSLGLVNRSIQNLQKEGFINKNNQLLPHAKEALAASRPKSAVILAAGYGMRMVPINTEVPKGLLEVHGEPLIERLIKQLQEAGVYDIHIVTGYLKEEYEYLIDQYNVNLIVNMEYADKNNLVSLAKAAHKISNTYIVPCDLYAKENPFSSRELYSWYMVNDQPDFSSPIRINRKGEFSPVKPKSKKAANNNKDADPAEAGLIQKGKKSARKDEETGCHMVGISYLEGDFSQAFLPVLKEMGEDPAWSHAFWEEAMLKTGRSLYAKVVPADQVIEINTYEQLRDLDKNSNQLNTPAIDAIMEAMHVPAEKIENIKVLKKGMTNRSFLFEVDGSRYIMRIPGEGTDQLINRKEEAQVYDVIKDQNLCDDIVMINPKNGYKITRFVENAHNCDPGNWDEVKECLQVLRKFHEKGLEVDHTFEIFDLINFYEGLRPGKSMYRDYDKVKEQVMALQPWIDSLPKQKTLCHIDSVCDNFLITEDGKIRLIDWEYAGMQDPHLDIAMHIIYAMYDPAEADRVIDLYFDNQCDEQTRLKINAYIAAAGLLWSNWCEFKASLGLEFGEYAMKQYRYAKEYARKVWKELDHA